MAKLQNTEFVQNLVRAFAAGQIAATTVGMPKGTLRGTIVDVDDPEERGRVRVVFDDMNPDIPQVSGAGEWSQEIIGEEPDRSHWIDTSPAFKGRQPRGLVGKRVNISASNGQYQYAVLQDVMFDPQLLAKNKGKKLEMPNNSSMTRLPIYGAGGLPPASAENHGCMVVESGGPMQSDWLCVCLRRNGKYLWVRHVDLAHGHAGQNDSSQLPDKGGDGQQPIKNVSVWDNVFPTTAAEMPKASQYGTDVRPNPYGGAAKWYGGAT